jgi:hypothetical protein
MNNRVNMNFAIPVPFSRNFNIISPYFV